MQKNQRHNMGSSKHIISWSARSSSPFQLVVEDDKRQYHDRHRSRRLFVLPLFLATFIGCHHTLFFSLLLKAEDCRAAFQSSHSCTKSSSSSIQMRRMPNRSFGPGGRRQVLFRTTSSTGVFQFEGPSTSTSTTSKAEGTTSSSRLFQAQAASPANKVSPGMEFSRVEEAEEEEETSRNSSSLNNWNNVTIAEESSTDDDDHEATKSTTATTIGGGPPTAVVPAVATSGNAGGCVYIPAPDHDDYLSKGTARTLTLSFVAGLTLLFTSLIRLSGPGGWRYFLAGGICASLSHALTTPLDVIKTRQQVEHQCIVQSGGKPTDDGILRTTLAIIKEDGIRSLLAGFGPTTVGYLLEGAIKFGVYEVLKPLVKAFMSGIAQTSSCSGSVVASLLSLQIVAYSLCATVSGFAAAVMLCPMEALRIRLVAEPDFAKKSHGWVHGGLKMLRHEGVGGLMKGFGAMTAKQVPYTVTKQVSFDYITSVAYTAWRSVGWAVNSRVMVLVPLMSAMMASMLSCVASQPGDMLLSVVNAHEGNMTATDFARDILREEGWRGFFVGVQARLVHVGLIVTVQLLVYDLVKRLCGVAATGSQL